MTNFIILGYVMRPVPEPVDALFIEERLGYQPCWFNVNIGREVQNHPTQPIH
jgi:hypothetical protein